VPFNTSKYSYILNYRKAQVMAKKHFLTNDQLESLTSPVRLAIVQRLEIDREATAREIARRLGRPVTSLYHHLNQLQDAGVLRVVAKRKGARRPEAVYALVADSLSSAQAVKSPRGRKTHARAAARVADAGTRAFSAAVAHGMPRFEGEARNAMVRYYLLRADRKKLAAVNRLLAELEEAATHSSGKGEEIQLTILLSPCGR
jgi:predicted ArsR family transcriptional regulator